MSNEHDEDEESAKPFHVCSGAEVLAEVMKRVWEEHVEEDGNNDDPVTMGLRIAVSGISVALDVAEGHDLPVQEALRTLATEFDDLVSRVLGGDGEASAPETETEIPSIFRQAFGGSE